ncbi:MMPL family transporter [Sabulicella glaciei]|uniref:MMPL family transporter n=1 Tax=Sabulicella glaciei TaxID=2984948 RepID=A0ABT3NXE8_9PROT|nr:MMPL family transporter [Roseococcus sp. MDT2-1-1]MCW8086852.1 MMPL family transporter [Roseococcus sp. MDT2-1-1]
MRPFLALLLLAALGGALLARHPPRADLAEFLPPGNSPASTFLFRELRSGAATTLLLAAIEGAPRAEMARLSRETAASLRTSGRFSFVGDGTLRLGEAEEAFLFRHRYLLSGETRPDAFTAEALRPRLEALLDGLRGAAAPLLARFGFADPTGAFPRLAARWLGENRLESSDGAWFTTDGSRVLLLARSAGGGLDAEAQREAMAAFREGFAAASPPPGARLLLSGPGVFAAEAAASIRADVQLASGLGASLLALFLFWRFRSAALLLLVAVPLLAGALAGYALTLLVFGTVHAVALGFGMTMLGVTVDYPILLLTLRRPGEAMEDAARRLWPTLRLAAGAAAAGLIAMLGSGLPGLAQLGSFAAAGVVTAALTTRWLLPRLAPPGFAAEPRALPASVLRPLRALQGRRTLALGAMGLAVLALLASGGPRLQRDMAALSPVPAAQQSLDAELRAVLGAPDVRALFVLGPAASEEEALRGAEALRQAAAPLLARGLLAGLDLPSDWLPSLAAQRERQASLPAPEELAEALRAASAGLPFRPTAFRRFEAAVAESRALDPITPEAFAREAPVLSARLSPLLARQEGAHWAIAPASGVSDPLALEAAAAGLGLPGVAFLDTKLEMERLLLAYGTATLGWAAAGGALVLLILGWGLGGLRPALRAAGPIGGALLLALATLALAGEALNLFHLAALLLLAGLAIDYALFLARAEMDPRTLEAVLTCVLSTLLTFGLLLVCETPVLRGIGLTVSAGVASAFLLALALLPRRAA